MRRAIPARAATCAVQIQTFQHEPELTGIDLDMPLADAWLRAQGERSTRQTLITRLRMQTLLSLQRVLYA